MRFTMFKVQIWFYFITSVLHFKDHVCSDKVSYWIKHVPHSLLSTWGGLPLACCLLYTFWPSGLLRWWQPETNSAAPWTVVHTHKKCEAQNWHAMYKRLQIPEIEPDAGQLNGRKDKGKKKVEKNGWRQGKKKRKGREARGRELHLGLKETFKVSLLTQIDIFVTFSPKSHFKSILFSHESNVS